MRRRGRSAGRAADHTASITLALLIVPAVVALALADRYSLGVPATLIAVVLSGATPAGVYLAWAAYRGKPGAPEGRKLSEVADDLAAAIHTQWDEEARVRRLYDPYALPVTWAPADASLVDPWDVLVRHASGAGHGRAGSAATWAAGPGELGGMDDELPDVLLRVPTGRLVVLGGPGAGKTALMIRLVRELLQRRAAGTPGPVPVLVSLASWDPAAQGLRQWLTAQLTTAYPALAAPGPGLNPVPLSDALLDQGLLLPVLDGLDEIPARARGQAIAKINAELLPGRQVIVTCRKQEYADTISNPGGGTLTVRAAAGIELRALDAKAVEAYLTYDGGRSGPDWSPVITSLGTPSPVGLALTTPLMVTLARTIYNPREGEYGTRLPEPAELCRLSSREAVEQHLFDAFIPAAYRDSAGSRRNAVRAEAILVFLACHLERTVESTDLGWWQLAAEAPMTSARGISLGVTFGASLGILLGYLASLLTGSVLGHHAAATTAGYVAGLAFFAAAAPAGAWLGGRTASFQPPSSGLRFSWEEVPFGLGSAAYGFAAGLIIGVRPGIQAGLKARAHESTDAAIRVGLAADLRVGLPTAIAFGFLATALGIFTMFEPYPGRLDTAVSPEAVLARDRRATQLPLLLLVAMLGLAAAAAVVLLPGDMRALQLQPAVAVGGAVALGLVIGLTVTSYRTAWLDYQAVRISLALRRRLPWALMSFLADAHLRGVLRNAGATYQFRHIELQRRLATRA